MKISQIYERYFPLVAYEKSFRQACTRIQKAFPFLTQEDLICLLCLLTAEADSKSLLIGAGIGSLGIALKLWYFAYQGTSRSDQPLGPFRFVRQPLPLAQWLLFFGSCLAARSFLGLIAALMFLSWNFQQGRQLEKASHKFLGVNEYRYSRFVPALIPSLIPYRYTAPQLDNRFSWKAMLLAWPKEERYRLFRLLLSGLAIFLASSASIPPMSLPILAGIWAFILCRRLFLRRNLFLLHHD